MDEGAGIDEADVAGFVADRNQAEGAAALPHALAGAQEIVGVHSVTTGESHPARTPVEPVTQTHLPTQVPSPGVVRIVSPIDARAGDRRVGHLREAAIGAVENG